MTIDRLSPYAKNRVFLCFLCKSFANRDYSALIFNHEKTHRISKFSIKPFRTISIRYLSVFLLNLKLTIMFNWKYIFVSTGLFWSALICFASCGSHFSSVFSSTGRRPASLGLVSVVRPSVRALTFSLNIFFAETTYRILMKFHRNVPTMVLFRISWNNLIPSKTLVAMATKLKIFWNLWKSSCQKP